jgi:cytochrome P450
LETFAEWHRRYGEVVRLPLTWPTVLQLHSPADIRHVLMTGQANYRKTGGLRAGAELFGRGLIRSKGKLYRRQRAIIEPSFHRPKITAMAGPMARETAATLADWAEGELDLARAMGMLTLRVVVRALFNADLSREAAQVVDDLLVCMRFIHPTTLLLLPAWVPTPGRRAYRRALSRIEAVAFDLIERRRREPAPGDDLLAVLVRARDEHGAPIDDRQLRDEVMTLMLAGHGTTATGLSWLWYELGKQPDLFARLRAEVDQVLGPDRLPDADAARRLELVEAAFRESLRLHPPVWAIGRRAVAEDLLPSGTPVPAGAIVTVLPPILQRRADLYPEPLAFRPQRFLRETRQPLPAGSFVPFSAGARSCIGEGLALLEAVIIIAMVVRAWDIEPVPGPPPAHEALLVWRPRDGLRVRLRRRW